MALNLPRFEAPRFTALHPSTGRPVSGGSVLFYVAGTSALKSVFSDRAGATPAANPHPLDMAGSCEVFLSGPYRVEVRDANGATVYTADYVNSIPVETPEGNPGSLLAANNLADLVDPAVAREALGLARQSGTYDTTAGRLLMVGAGGLLGNCGEVLPPMTLDTLPTSWRRVAAGNIGPAKGPAGAGDIVVSTVRYDADQASQVAESVSAAGAPWRRRQIGGVWSAWIRDVDSGSNDNGAWVRHGGGMQECYATLDFDWANADTLRCDWTYPAQFSSLPWCSYSLRAIASAYSGGLRAGYLGPLEQSTTHGPTVTLSIARAWGAPNFGPSARVTRVRVRAFGPWQ